MRNNRNAPLLILPAGATYKTEVVTAGADDLPFWQPCVFGTTAWTESIGRRQLVETDNSRIHGANGAHVEISRGFTTSRNRGRIKLFLVYTLAGVNEMIVFDWMRDHRLLDPSHPDALSPERKPRAPRKDRAKRWDDLAIPSRAGPPG
jgi:hypothetical protein